MLLRFNPQCASLKAQQDQESKSMLTVAELVLIRDALQYSTPYRSPEAQKRKTYALALINREGEQLDHYQAATKETNKKPRFRAPNRNALTEAQSSLDHAVMRGDKKEIEKLRQLVSDLKNSR